MRDRPLPWHQLGSFALALPVAAMAVGGVGLARLSSQFPGALSSPGLLAPFALPVLGLALEAAALIALVVAQLDLLTRWRAAPRKRARATWPLLGVVLLALAVAEVIPRGTEHPGAFANELLQSARSSCGPSGEVPVPLLGLNVRCSQPRRIQGPMPGVRSVTVSMGELSFSDDLRSVEIAGLELAAERSLRVRLSASHARIAGLAPWSRSPRLSAAERWLVLGALGAALWLATVLLRWKPPVAVAGPADPTRSRLGRWLRRGAGLAMFALPGVLVAAAVIRLDQERAAPLVYVAAVLPALLLLAGIALLVRRLPQILGSFLDF